MYKLIKRNKYINESDIKLGHLYLEKDGCLLIYCGRLKEGYLFTVNVFYVLGSLPIIKSGSIAIQADTCLIPNYDEIIEFYKGLYNKLLNGFICDEHCFVRYTNLPNFYEDICSSDNFKDWYTALGIINTDIPVVDLNYDDIAKEKVSARDLKVGEYYISTFNSVGTPHEGLFSGGYIYLGKTKRFRNFAWLALSSARLSGTMEVSHIINTWKTLENELGVSTYDKKMYKPVKNKFYLDFDKLNENLRKELDEFLCKY